jgi:hypothetical protein
MNGIAGWLLGILAIVILGVVVDLMLSEGKTAKYIKSVFAAVTVLIIILPLPGIIKNGIDFDAPFMINNQLELDNGYLNYTAELKLRAIARGVEEQLDKDGVHKAAVRITGSATGVDIKIEKVDVNLTNSVIDENKGHINKYELLSGLISGYLSIDKGLVSVNE